MTGLLIVTPVTGTVVGGGGAGAGGGVGNGAAIGVDHRKFSLYTNRPFRNTNSGFVFVVRLSSR
ncbi:MAG: hypothetical protein FWD99_00975 [Oscillospiraceae bacterium]|nr:hypothetical protein [Oscillospiraceae bacterium]